MSGVKQGILVTDIKINETTKKSIITRNTVIFNESNRQKYLDKFNVFVNEGKIVSESFENNTWTLVKKDDGYEDRNNIMFVFENRKRINNSLKFYCIDKLTNKLGGSEIFTNLKLISEMLYTSNIFNEENYEDFEDYIFDLSVSQQTKLKDAAWEYISYVQKDIPEEYFILLSSLKNAEKQSRILPDYRSILYFDYLMNKFIEEGSKELKYKYYPVILWWKITSFIPTRPIEFTRLKKAGIYPKENKYLITIERAKPHGYIERAMNTKKEQVFELDKHIYEMIIEYTSLENHTGEYLLSYNLLKVFRLNNKMRGKQDLIRKYTLKALLDEFYVEVIEGMYNFRPLGKMDVIMPKERIIKKVSGNEIVKLQLGDTRHLAIINLVLQGYDPYTVKELAGHRDINAHVHYYSHVEKFVESKTLMLTDIIRSEYKTIETKVIKPQLVNRRLEKSIKLRLKDQGNNGGLLKVEGGYCPRYNGNIDLYPSLCLTNCSDCNYKIRDTEEIKNEFLDNQLRSIQNEIDKQIEIIKFYLMNSSKLRLIDHNSGKFNPESKRNLKTAANRLENLIVQKSREEAYKLILKEV